jgi:hypothetical protein
LLGLDEKEEARLRLIGEKEILNSLDAQTTPPGLRPLVEKRLAEIHRTVQTTYKESLTPYLTFPSRTFLERIPGIANIWKDVIEMYVKRDDSERKRIQAAYDDRLRMMQASRQIGVPGLANGGNAQAGPSRIQVAPAMDMVPTPGSNRPNFMDDPGPDEFNLPARAGPPLQEDEYVRLKDAIEMKRSRTAARTGWLNSSRTLSMGSPKTRL